MDRLTFVNIATFFFANLIVVKVVNNSKGYIS